MRKWSRYLVGVVAVTGLVPLAALAETCTLEMKRVDPQGRTTSSGMPADYLFRSTYPQSFFQQLGGPEGMARGADDGKKPAFSDVVKKEPAEYAAETPFRGVAELGSRHYGFVLDIAPPAKDAKEDDEEEEKAADKQEGSLLSALAKTLGAPVAKKSEAKTVEFTRLYFDLNGNGDLTDDGVIEATSSQSYSTSMSRSTFPTTEMTIEVDGKKVDYAFTFGVYSNVSGSLSYANASLNAAAYREGEITLDGQKRRVVLIDFNSNGRFDDAPGIRDDAGPSDGPLYPRMGDTLYIDPQPVQVYRSPYDPTTSDDQHYVNKLIAFRGRFYDLEIDPSGETLSLKPSDVPVGYVSNPNPGFRAIVYGQQGMLKISEEEGKAPLPEGEWKLLSYTIQQNEPETPKEEEEKKEEERSVLEVLGSMLTAVAPAVRPSTPRPTIVSARATGDFRAIKVVGGETAQMPFGPPYTPRVTAAMRPGQAAVSLSMSLIGSGGEVCSNLVVKGTRPGQPEFTIVDKDGEEVASGKFAYG